MLRDIKRVKDRVLVLPTMAARPTAPESPDNPELARLVARASLLLSQGNIGAARIVLERAAETGSGLAPPLGAPTNTRRARRWLKILPVTACLVAAAAGWWHYRSEVVTVVEMTILPVTQASDHLAQVKQALQQEREKAEKLAQELATARRELATVRREPGPHAAALTKSGDKAAQNQQLTELRQALQQAEWLSAAYQEMLSQERARIQGLEEQLATLRGATPVRGRNATVSLSDTPGPTQAATTDKAAAIPIPTRDSPAMAADEPPATMAAQPTAPESPDNPERARLMSRASLLLGQGNVAAARTVLERAAETGSIPALFALAETYDPAVLSAWRTVGTQGDVAKARELYARALAGGIHEAKDRLNALP